MILRRRAFIARGIYTVHDTFTRGGRDAVDAKVVRQRRVPIGAKGITSHICSWTAWRRCLPRIPKLFEPSGRISAKGLD
jgi:hypothetical protein